MISVIIPVMNEEDNLQLMADCLNSILSDYKPYEIIFIDDGSSDGSLDILSNLSEAGRNIKYISFSRNFGHQNALKAGMDFANGDCVISIDGDFQHPAELIPEMIEKWKEGYDIVYTKRLENKNSGFFKRHSARLFYKILNSLSDVKIEYGCADFRLLDRYVVDILKRFDESPLFYRGLIKWIGFRQYGISYTVKERSRGQTKYTLSKMIRFALSGITGFSVKPLQVSFRLGLSIAFLAFIYGLYALYAKMFTGKVIEGWTSLIIVISLMGGIQLITIGILGEYIGKLFTEQKKRPHYIVKKHSSDLYSDIKSSGS